MTIKIIEKPWGKEELIEINKKYMFKRLTMFKGNACSLQYHEFKTETVYLLSGCLKIYIGDKEDILNEIIMKSHDVITIQPKKIHRMEALEDSVYLEASTPELNDVVRLKDNYDRV